MAWNTLERPGIAWFLNRRQQPFWSLVVASSGGPVVSFCHHAEHRSTREVLGNGSEGYFGGAEVGSPRAEGRATNGGRSVFTLLLPLTAHGRVG